MLHKYKHLWKGLTGGPGYAPQILKAASGANFASRYFFKTIKLFLLPGSLCISANNIIKLEREMVIDVENLKWGALNN